MPMRVTKAFGTLTSAMKTWTSPIRSFKAKCASIFFIRCNRRKCLARIEEANAGKAYGQTTATSIRRCGNRQLRWTSARVVGRSSGPGLLWQAGSSVVKGADQYRRDVHRVPSSREFHVSLRSPAVIIPEHAAEPLAAFDIAGGAADLGARHQEVVFQPLVITLA